MSVELPVEQDRTVAVLVPPSTEGAWRHAWLAPLVVALSLLPAVRSTGLSMPGTDEPPGPTQQVVEALRRSVGPSATPATPPAPKARETPSPLFGSPQEQKLAGQLLFLGAAGDRDRALDCLGLAAWYEAGDNVEYQRSVMQVILNRVAHPAFPKSICGVVFEGSHRKTGCQFTFTCDGSMMRRRPSPAAMARARSVAELALNGTTYPSVMQATHYHADYVQPWWSGALVRLGKVGQHIFYSWPGKRGELSGRPSSAGEADLTQFARQGAGPAPGLKWAGEPTASAPEETAAWAAVAPDAANAMSAAFAPKPGTAIFFTVDRQTPSGRWAVSALGQCAGKTGCRVLAYETQEQSARNSAVPAPTREKPVFLFVRDAGSGIELALWDCEKVKRPASSQCLPNAGRELDNLLRDRQS